MAALAAAPAASAAPFNVTSLGDNGAGTLRQAILDANAAAGADVITFQSGLTGTITLTTGQLEIYDSVDIQGPGAAVITVSGNNASRVFYMYNGSADIDVRIAGLTITQGLDTVGAGVVDFGENLTLDAVTIDQNQVQGTGGGVWASGSSMNLSILNSTISGNIAAGNGGGLYVGDTGGPLLIENSIISGNQASNAGGGIFFYDPDDTVTIRDTTISGNTTSGGGGGVYLYDTDGGAVTFERSTITGNSAASGGGLFFYGPDDPVNIENCTITGNNATESYGGGIYFYGLYNGMSVNFTTITDNSAPSGGGGFFLAFGIAPISNSIVAGNTAPDDPDLGDGCGCASFDLRYTLVGDTTGSNINDITGNILDADPMLGPLQNNGGPTETQRPALTSPVVNAADPGIGPPPATDQRGQPRFYPTRADMGALELVGGVIQFNPQTYTVAENTPGSVTLTVVRDVGPDPASVAFTTNPGTATPGVGNDYTTMSGTLNFAVGDLSETFNVPILDDTAVEGSEQFTATLSNPSVDATIGAANPATVTITDFEPGQIVFSSATYSGSESGGSIQITVNRVGGSSGPASVNFTTAPGTATAGPGNDYTTTSGPLSWLDGDATPRTFNVPILDDSTAEGNENFTVSLNTPSGAAIGSPGTATVTIVDDPAGTAQFNVSTINTTEDAGIVTVTVTRTGGTEGALVVNYATANGTATAPQDYTAAAGGFTFPAGSAAAQSFNITIINDSLTEGQEMFTANLTGPGVGSPSSVSIVIPANDVAASDIPTLSFFGKILFGLMSAIVGLYAIVRNRFSVMLLGLLLVGLVATPPVSAQMKKNQKTSATVPVKEKKDSKISGTLLSITNNGGTSVLNLSGGISITVPTKLINVVDARNAKPAVGSLEQVVAGAHLIVKLKTDEQGNIKSVKIKLTP